MSKKILFISPIGHGGPSELYHALVPLLQEMYGTGVVIELSDTIFGWVKSHFIGGRYDCIISVLPFLWRPGSKRFFLNIHGDYRKEQGWKSLGAILAFCYPWSARFADIIIFPSEYLKKTLRFPEKEVHVIGNFTHFPLRENPKNISDRAKVIKIITITNWHNTDKANAMIDLIEHFYKEGLNTNITVAWTIVGGWADLYKKKVMGYKIDGIEIELLGYVDHENLVHLLDTHDIFIYNTYAETFGIAILEAACRGLPLILNKYDAFYGIWDESQFFNIETMLGELLKLSTDNIYYRARSLSALKDAAKYGPKNILGKWKEILDKF